MGKQLELNLAHFEQLALDRSLRRKEAAQQQQQQQGGGSGGVPSPQTPQPQPSAAAGAATPASDGGNPFGEDDEDDEEEGKGEELEEREKQAREEEEAREERELEEVVGFVREVDGSFINLFLRFSDAYQGLFVHRPDTSPDDRTAALGLLDDFALALFRRYLALVRTHLLVRPPHPRPSPHSFAADLGAPHHSSH
jgi:hypothetical protein